MTYHLSRTSLCKAGRFRHGGRNDETFVGMTRGNPRSVGIRVRQNQSAVNVLLDSLVAHDQTGIQAHVAKTLVQMPCHAEASTATHPGVHIILVAIVQVAGTSGATRSVKTYYLGQVLIRHVGELVAKIRNFLPGGRVHGGKCKKTRARDARTIPDLHLFKPGPFLVAPFQSCAAELPYSQKECICYIVNMLGIEQKKGNDENLCGRMIAYARILPSPDGQDSGTPFDDLIRNGLLALEGDFREAPKEPSPREMSKAVDKKLNHLLETMQEQGMDLPENVDVDSLRSRLKELSSMEVIPIPARIGNFGSEEEILEEDADVYFIGEFIGMNQAHYCLTTLPIYYQARYREQAKVKEMAVLNEMLSQFETGEFMDDDDIQKETELFPEGLTLNTFIGDLGHLLNTRVIPFLLACENEEEYDSQIDLFYKFMKDYPQQIDISRVDHALRELRRQSDCKEARMLLEFTCRKINAIYSEDTKTAEELEAEIESLRF